MKTKNTKTGAGNTTAALIDALDRIATGEFADDVGHAERVDALRKVARDTITTHRDDIANCQMAELGGEAFAKIARIQQLAEDMPAPESGFVTWGSVADMGLLVDGLNNILAWLGRDEK